MPCRATKEGWAVEKCSDKTWSSERGNGNSLQYSCLENPMNNMKRQKEMIAEDELPTSKVFNMLLGKSEGQLLIAPEKMKQLGQSRNDVQ